MTDEMRKLIETIEQINEVSDFDGPVLDELVAKFKEACKELGIDKQPVKMDELTSVILTRVMYGDDEDYSGYDEGGPKDPWATWAE